MSAPLWSIGIICKNEEQSIQTLIDSLEEFISRGGEIVVVDTGSTDQTINILNRNNFGSLPSRLRYEEVGSKFNIEIDEIKSALINEKFGEDGDIVSPGKTLFHFSDARNYVASLCSHDWIFCPDCDEKITTINIDFINHIIQTGDVHQLSFPFNYRNKNGGITSSTSRDKFYNRSFCKWKYIVHEQALPIDNIHRRIIRITGSVLTVDHYQHPAEHRSNYLPQMCIDVMNYPTNDRHLHWLGRELLYSRRYKAAISVLKKHVKDPIFSNCWSAEKCMSCIYIGDACKYLGRNRMIVEMWYLKATLFERTFREPWVKLAEFRMGIGDFMGAIQACMSALTITKNPSMYMNDQQCYKTKPHIIAYKAYHANGNNEEAYTMWERAKCLDPQSEQIKKDSVLFVNCQI